jgi:hypothetical protein
MYVIMHRGNGEALVLPVVPAEGGGLERAGHVFRVVVQEGKDPSMEELDAARRQLEALYRDQSRRASGG